MQATIDAHPDWVQCFVDGSAKGWYNYLYGDNSAANAAIKKDNPEMSDEQIAFSIKALKDHGVTPIEAMGAAFDPMKHEAMLQDFQTDAPPGVVSQEFQRGYCMRDRVLRPAKVAVAAAKPDAVDSRGETPGTDEVNDADV